MTKTQRKKAVQIAEDVLAQLRARKYVATAGTYVDLNDAFIEGKNYWEDVPVVKSLQTFLKKHAKKKSCHVCALGACFLANVERRNKVDLEDFYGRRDIEVNLAGIFSAEQMDEIETAFEGNTSHGGSWDAVAFGNRYHDDTARLRAIMRNIIKNDGEFIPTKAKR